MSSAILCPGVYIQEVSTGTRPIEAVGTRTAAFVGEAPNPAARRDEAVAINNWTAFVREFVHEGDKNTPLSQAVHGFFENGGSRCIVVNVGSDQPITGHKKGLEVLDAVDEVAIVAAPGKSDAQSHDDLLSHCEKMQDRVAILDPPADVSNIEDLTKVAAVAVPGARSGDAEDLSGMRPRVSERGYGAFYFPYITVRNALKPRELINTAPSGYLAGIYARSDATRGVHKAPANEVVRGALNVTYRVTTDEQGLLNSNGVNVIRFFQKEGILVWGARTLADSASEWRYINVRRLFNQVEESIALHTKWVVFEPNDETLWKSIRRDIGAFLTLLWRDGALAGRTPEEAFFVKCDAETNTPDVIDAGRVVTLIGMAPVKPAEFVLFKIGQHQAGSETTE